jgi:hypothetical protein
VHLFDAHAGHRLALSGVVNTGLVARAVAGIVGPWAMSEAQRLWTRVVDGHAGLEELVKDR